MEIKHSINPFGDLYVEIYGKSNDDDNEIILSEIEKSILHRTIYFNNLSGKHWSFDYKLPCGVWVENIEYTDALTTVKCEVWLLDRR